jgi:hypothetical protein
MPFFDNRTAILRAADHLESAPWSYAMNVTRIPYDQFTLGGCVLAWIAYYAGYRPWSLAVLFKDDQAASLAKVLVGRSFHDLVDWMDDHDRLEPGRVTGDGSSWIMNASTCARRLRHYADLYYPVVETPLMAPVYEVVEAVCLWLVAWARHYITPQRGSSTHG